MSKQEPATGSPQGSRPMFNTTPWTAVVTAAHRDTPEARDALTHLCRIYWPPVHAYLRRLGRTHDEANDLTQEFFYVLLSKNYLGAADRAKGRFRSFLLTAVNHFLGNELDRARAAKRGGGQIVLSLDYAPDAGEFARIEPVTDVSPARAFERQWARTLLRLVENKLRDEHAARGKAEVFDRLKEFLDARTESGEYAAVAAALKISPRGVAVAVHRLRQRYAELIRAEVAQTLVRPTAAEIEEEVRHLLNLFSQ